MIEFRWAIQSNYAENKEGTIWVRDEHEQMAPCKLQYRYGITRTVGHNCTDHVLSEWKDVAPPSVTV